MGFGGWDPRRSATDILGDPNDLELGMLEAISPASVPHPGPIQTMGTQLQGRQILETAVRQRSTGLPQAEIDSRVAAMYSGLDQPGMTNQLMGEFINTWQAPTGSGPGWEQYNVPGDLFSGPSAGMPGLPTGDEFKMGKLPDYASDKWVAEAAERLGAGGAEAAEIAAGLQPAAPLGDFAQAWDDALFGSREEALAFADQLEGDANQSAFIGQYFDEMGVNLETPLEGYPDPITYDDIAIPVEDQTDFWEWYNEAGGTGVSEQYGDNWVKAHEDWKHLKAFVGGQVATGETPATADPSAGLNAPAKQYLKDLEVLRTGDASQKAEYEKIKNAVYDAMLKAAPGDWSEVSLDAAVEIAKAAQPDLFPDVAEFDWDELPDDVKRWYPDPNAVPTPTTTEEGVDVEAKITEIYEGVETEGDEATIRERMSELGTKDLRAAIRAEFATITTPDYGPAITQRFGEMETAVEGAAAERRRILEESTTRAEERVGEIKTGLAGELETLETDRVAQQEATEQQVIDRTTEFEQALTERLTTIRADLGEQVTTEFEEVATLVESLTASQATSSRDAMSRLSQIGDMAAAARLSAPAELSAEALTALSDLEFQVENQIAQGLADQRAQIEVDMAGSLLQETMRQGDFETAKQQQLVQALLGEQLRGVTYEDRTKEMLVEQLLGNDQYVRQFNDQVDMAMAQAQLTNLFGTQDYERQLDMMNLQRGWTTQDTTTQYERGLNMMQLEQAFAESQAAQANTWDMQAASLKAAADAAASAVGTSIGEQISAQFPDLSDDLLMIALNLYKQDDATIATELENLIQSAYQEGSPMSLGDQATLKAAIAMAKAMDADIFANRDIQVSEFPQYAYQP